MFAASLAQRALPFHHHRPDGPEHLRPIGETEFVIEIAAHADLRGAHLDEVLDAHEDAGRGLFRGIRHAGVHDPNPEALRIAGRAPADLYQDEAYRAGVARLGKRGLSFDTWHYHHQN